LNIEEAFQILALLSLRCHFIAFELVGLRAASEFLLLTLLQACFWGCERLIVLAVDCGKILP